MSFKFRDALYKGPPKASVHNFFKFFGGPGLGELGRLGAWEMLIVAFYRSRLDPHIKGPHRQFFNISLIHFWFLGRPR